MVVTGLQLGPGAQATITTVNVKIIDFKFQPSLTKVVIGVNNTVTWTNDGLEAHTVTANGGSFDSGVINAGGQFTRTFTTVGTFGYHCALHPTMTGSVVVISSTSSTSFPWAGVRPVRN
ncbi:MAG: cupredoxin domain-containing protein [Thaumarchaeota archaeon]|nr:cupredoxin domain-containing protein [Nitrososphaerota archaeon]